jgi:FixJ family two-component response regulator
MTTPATVLVVDDDASVCKGLSRLLRAGGYAPETFASAAEFLASGRHQAGPACLVLDVRLPGLTGMQLQERLCALHSTLAIVFITGHGDIPMSVEAMKGGAVDFLPKPFDDSQLLAAVARALEKSVRDHETRRAIQSIQDRVATLTPREREVMELIVTGLLNKQVADKLGTVEKTIKVHRAHVLEKMQVQSLTELARLAERIGMGKTNAT